MKEKYDYLIVGAGLFGAVFAHEATQKGKKCLVIDKRDHIGGNCYCDKIEGINVHKYGAHIFHTSDKKIWEYVNRLTPFNGFMLNMVADHKGQIYNLPFNMNTFSRIWGIVSPEEAKAIINDQKKDYISKTQENLEEQAISLVGKDLYEILIKYYVKKQWGRDCKELPPFIIRRIPLRFTYDNNYYDDPYQGIPETGYNALFEKLLEGSCVLLNTEYDPFIKENKGIAFKTIYTGTIDGYYKYRFGALEYRSVYYENEIIATDNYQGTAVMSFTDMETKYTRVIEHKHFEFGEQKNTVISREFFREWDVSLDPYYPINDKKNTELYSKYALLAKDEKSVVFGGRLGEYRYYDMDKVIAAALGLCEKEFGNPGVPSAR